MLAGEICSAIVDGLESNDLAGITKEEVKAALNAYEEAVIVVQNQANTVAELYLAGDAEASANANNGATKNLEALGAAETAFMDIVKLASDNLIEQKRVNVDGYSSISSAMFYAFIVVAVVMIFYVNISIAKPAKNASSHLSRIIEKIDNKIICTPLDGSAQFVSKEDDLVSMNMLLFTPKIFEYLECDFVEFFDNIKDIEKDEFLIPVVVDKHLKTGDITVEVIETDSNWYGITYKEDKELVVDAINDMISDNVYTSPLW